MGKYMGMRMASAFGLMVAATVAITACGDSDSGTTGYDYEIVGESSSSIVGGFSSSIVGEPSSSANGPVSEIPLSSFDISAGYSSAGIHGGDPYHMSSSVSFDSAYFGGVVPRSSSGGNGEPGDGRNPNDNRDPGTNPGDNNPSENPNGNNSGDNNPPSSSSVQTHAQYSKILGVDVSQMQEFEAKGTRVLDTDGTPKDVFELFRDYGFNYIRLKTFVGPKSKYGYAAGSCDQGAGTFGSNSEAFGDKEHVVAYAKRAKAAGLKLLLDFHYSDNWADPGKQIIPERWRNISNSGVLADSVYAYTKDVLTALKDAGALPDMVQVGNEITNGMLRDVPNGSTDCWGNNVDLANSSVSGVMSNATGIANTAKYLAAGSRAVKEISSDIKTVFHIESPHKTSTVEWWMKSIIQNSKVTPDVMAFSAYTAYEHGNPDSWKTLMTNLGKTYSSLEFLIAEYNGAQTKDSYSFDGSRARTQQIMEQVPRGLGAFIWEPERSGAWGTSMFDWVGNDLKANKRAFDEYEVLF